MINENRKSVSRKNNVFSIFVSLLVGGLAGAVTMLLLAPQSGEDTRLQIQEKEMDLVIEPQAWWKMRWRRYVWIEINSRSAGHQESQGIVGSRPGLGG